MALLSEKTKERMLLPLMATLGAVLTIVLPAWGWTRRIARLRWKSLLVIACLAVGSYSFPFLMNRLEAFSRRFPVLTWQFSAGLAAVSFFLLSLAAVLYVGFRFLASILAIELQVAREFQSANKVFKNYFQERSNKGQTEGNAIPVDEVVQAKLEDIRLLREKGLLKDDEIEDFVREAYGGGDGLPDI